MIWSWQLNRNTHAYDGTYAMQPPPTLAGLFPSFTSSSLPFRLKIIYQCQGKSHAYGGVTSALAKIWREEGIKGMFRGNGINCLRIMPYSATQFVSVCTERWHGVRTWSQPIPSSLTPSQSFRRLSGSEQSRNPASPSLSRQPRFRPPSPLPLPGFLRAVQEALHQQRPGATRDAPASHRRSPSRGLQRRRHLPPGSRPE